MPVRKLDGYGLYVLEANAAGVPVLMPATGGFPEIIEKTGGGIVYSPDTVGELASNLLKILKDKKLLTSLGARGSEKVRSELSLEVMAAGLSEIYNKIIEDATGN